MTKKKRTPALDQYLDKFVNQLDKKIEVEKDHNELLKENRYLHSLLEITHSINTPRDFNQLLELIVDSAINLTKAERGFLMFFREDGNVEFKVTRNIDKKIMESEAFEISKTVVNQVSATGESLFLGDIYKDKNFKISKSIEALGLRMVMCVPLKAKDHLIGLIYVDSRSEAESFTKLEEKLFEAFAAQASVAIENSHLYDLSIHDALTSLYNYGYLRARLEQEISRASRYKRDTISFIMLDLDNFKSINDTYGHLFGNSVLIKVAELIKASVRKYDIAARYGGDEFAILMPDTDMPGGRGLAERIQKEIINLRMPVGNETVSVTPSIGISTFPIEKIIDIQNVIVEADHALLVAKGKGGNQIVVFGLRKDEKRGAVEFIGESRAIEEVKKTISRLAKTDATILISGETGTGKELVTMLLHSESARGDKPLVVVNCGAIPDNLLESELFGYEKGAFTGAYMQRKGKFELAHGGTLCLDEIGELPLHLQVKILRAIEQKEIDRIGGKQPITVDVRLIAATNKNLEEEVRKSNFRKDLFYRLSVATVNLPSLRERPEDIEALSTYYLKLMNKRYARKILGFTDDAMKAMITHAWSGNVRELIHRIERAVIMARGQYLDPNDLGISTPKLTYVRPLNESRDVAEKESIVSALTFYRWNITHTSKALGITPKTLRYLIKKQKIIKSV